MSGRNEGPPTLTVWKDGSFVIHGARDAEYATLSEPDVVILNLDLGTHDAVTFLPAQARVGLSEKLFAANSKGGRDA